MKRIILLFVVFVSICFPYKQSMHQYITAEAYKLLKNQLGYDIPLMVDKIGGTSTWYIGDRNWQRRYITTGAWREDVDDIVYGYSSNNPPRGASTFFPIVLKAMNDDNEWYSSVTHFWYADDGDNTEVSMQSSAHMIPPSSGPIFTQTIFMQNAYQKISQFVNANRAFTIKYADGNSGHVSDFYLPNGSIKTISWFDQLGIEYSSLIELKNTGKAWIVGYYDSNGNWINSNLNPDLPFEVRLGSAWRDAFIWEILGRMCHLLEDMSVPAHANIDPHGNDDALIQDYYENYFGDAFYWNAENTFSQVGGFINPYQSSNPLHFLMYTTNQMANHFATQGPHYKPCNDNFYGNPLSEETSYLNSLNISGFGAPTSINGPFELDQKLNVRDHMLPQAIRATAGLLYWFAVESGLITNITVKNNFAGGLVKVNNQNVTAPFPITKLSGQSINLEAIPQTDNENYSRVWNNYAPTNRSKWIKQIGSSNIDLYGGENISYTIAGSMNDGGNVNYIANLKKICNISRNDQTEYDGTSSAGVVATIVEQNSGQISAPATKSVNGKDYRFYQWSDGNTSNPRSITPNNNATYTALYKAHLYSTSLTATSSNNQRKIVQSTYTGGLWAMVYVSSNQIWACRSTDGTGTSWASETLISDDAGYIDGYPSISTEGNVASIVWQRINWSGEPGWSNCLIVTRTFNLNSGALGPISQVTSFNPDIEAFTASPVVTGYSDDMMISWREPTGIKVRYYDNYSGWSSIASVPGTNSNSFNPSIAHYGAYASVAALVWEDRYIYNHLIKYTELFPSYSGPWSFSTVTNIAPTNWDNNSSPQFAMASSATKPTVVWSSKYNLAEGSASVHIRQKSSMVNGTWGNITSFTYPTFEDLKPVIGDFYIGAAMDVYWNILNTVYHSSTLNGTSWSAPSIVTTTGGSGVNVNRSALNQTKALWKKSSGNIDFTIAAISKVAATDDEKIPYRLNRHAIVDISKIAPKSSGSLAFEIAWVGLPEENKDKKIDFEHEGNKNLLSSKPFTVTSPGQTLFFAGAVYGSKLVLTSDAVSKIKEPLAKVSIKENKTDKVLQDIWIAPASMLLSVKDSTFGEYKEITVDLTKYVGKEIYLDVETAGKSKKVAPLFVDDYLFVSNSANANLGKRAAMIDELPTTYALKQNYPNPFNPSTMISYSVPNNTYVTLKVFDVLGNEVASLVNEEKTTGNYDIEFNASGLSSGIYFYRIQTESFVDTKKLILLK